MWHVFITTFWTRLIFQRKMMIATLQHILGPRGHRRRGPITSLTLCNSGSEDCLSSNSVIILLFSALLRILLLANDWQYLPSSVSFINTIITHEMSRNFLHLFLVKFSIEAYLSLSPWSRIQKKRSSVNTPTNPYTIFTRPNEGKVVSNLIRGLIDKTTLIWSPPIKPD